MSVDLFQQMEKIIRFQINEEGLDESTVDFENGVNKKITEYKFKPTDIFSGEPNILIISNRDLSLNYEDKEFEKYRPTLFIFCYAAEGFSGVKVENVLKEVREIIQTDILFYSETTPIIKLFFISNNLKTAIQSNAFLNSKDIRREVVQTFKPKLSKRDILTSYDYFESEVPIENCSVRVLSRTRATQSRSIGNPNTEGYVFSANLYDLVELYNKKGKTLFAMNIRYGIADELDVDSVIKETLMQNPEEFWYLNNGITLILEKNNLNLQNYNMISLSDSDKIKLTVINGAQTLNSAAEFFYTQEEQNPSKDKAFVMLKIIEITSRENETESVDNRIDKITISLNRQKPIITDDIAFTLPVIRQINKLRELVDTNTFRQEKTRLLDQTTLNPEVNAIGRDELKGMELNLQTSMSEQPLAQVEKVQPLENEEKDQNLSPYVFSIVRRGDVSSTRNKRYTLSVLPRILCAILLDQPGKARTASSKSLIDIDNDKNHFKIENLFPTVEQNGIELKDIDNQFKDIFLKNYKPVNFAMALYDEIDRSAKMEKAIELSNSNPNAQNVINYGKYLIIYSITKALNGNEESFENWRYNGRDAHDLLENGNYEKIITVLTNSWNETVKENTKWDSNQFKKNVNLIETYKNCKDKIQDILKIFSTQLIN
jgi:hypothetical protein